jgi:hypothetical protein
MAVALVRPVLFFAHWTTETLIFVTNPHTNLCIIKQGRRERDRGHAIFFLSPPARADLLKILTLNRKA